MPPSSVLDLAADLAEQYQAVEDHINQQIRALSDEPLTARHRSRLREILAELQREQRNLEVTAKAWIEDRLVSTYGQGMGSAASALGTTSVWTQAHREAVLRVATDTYAEVLDATRHMDDDLKRVIRDLGQQRTFEKIATGQTATGAGRDLRRDLARRGIRAVTYRDGSRVAASSYADMLMRTKTAVAYNFGALNTYTANGVTAVQIADGADCGLTFHQDPQKADGLIVTPELAAAYPIAHPNCRRDLLPRTDLTAADAQSVIGSDGQASHYHDEQYLIGPQRRPASSARELRSLARAAGRAPRTPRVPADA